MLDQFLKIKAMSIFVIFADIFDDAFLNKPSLPPGPLELL